MLILNLSTDSSFYFLVIAGTDKVEPSEHRHVLKDDGSPPLRCLNAALRTLAIDHPLPRTRLRR